MSFEIRQLTADDVALTEAVSTMFGEAFYEVATYTEKRPRAAYVRRLLGGESFVALAAIKQGDVVGGLAAYELQKFEQERSEIYIYDLAVEAARRPDPQSGQSSRHGPRSRPAAFRMPSSARPPD